ncbi:MAG: hypothetical protein IJX01_06095 [Oscillospiraceae bacterium]|nr:hypothetical protein [Oscillospiraceae bacterium]
MEYVGEANSFIYGAGNGSFNYVSADFTFNGEFYIAANGFFKVTDFSTASGIKKLNLPKSENVRAVLVEGDTAYLLCNIYNGKDPNKPLYISVYKTKDMQNFTEVTSFQYETTALSMAKHGDFLYLSMGHTSNNKPQNGMMIRIKAQ